MKLIAATAAILLTTASAYAADAIVYNEPTPVEVAQTSNWAGMYIYGLAGYENARTTNEHTVSGNFNAAGNHDDHKGKGGIYGAAAGYNWQFDNNVVIGAELGIRSGTKLDDDGYNLKYGNDYHQETSLKYLGTLKARLGYDAGGWMPYLTAGLAFGKIDADFNFQNTPTQRAIFEDSATKAGFVVGAGADVKVTENVFVGIEYNYTDLAKAKFSHLDSTGNPAGIDVKYKSHAVFAKVGYKF